MSISILGRNTAGCPAHTLGTGNKDVDKSRLIIKESFTSQNSTELKKNIQLAVDEYIRLVLKNGSLPTGNESEDLVE